MEVLAYHSYFGGIALEIALFRYNCIAELVRGPLPGGEQNRILQRLAHREWEAPGGVKVQVSVSALKAWLALYRQGGFEALKPRTRSDQGRPRAVDGTLLDRLARLKAELPQHSVPQLIRLLEKDPSSGIAPGSLKRATVYRHLAARGLTARTRKIRRAYHPFQRQAPGELWQLDETDGLLLPDPHRPGKWRKTVQMTTAASRPTASSTPTRRCPAWNTACARPWARPAYPKPSTSTGPGSTSSFGSLVNARQVVLHRRFPGCFGDRYFRIGDERKAYHGHDEEVEQRHHHRNQEPL